MPVLSAATRSVAGLVALLGVFAVVGARPAAADHRVGPVHYVGIDGNWFEPGNWSSRRVPGPHTDVVLDGVDNVVVDPARGAPTVEIRDLRITDAARLTTLPGTVFSARNERIEGAGSLVHRSTDATDGRSGTLELTGASNLILNPSTQPRRIVILKSTIAVTGAALAPTLQVGLGGTAPAAAGRVGPGRYATVTAESVQLAGRLTVTMHYGFTPRAGDAFQVITAGTLTGRFDNVGEGELVAVFGNAGLYITYRGGDGNDVVLEARELVLL
jgi:hypothetical protein